MLYDKDLDTAQNLSKSGKVRHLDTYFYNVSMYMHVCLIFQEVSYLQENIQ